MTAESLRRSPVGQRELRSLQVEEVRFVLDQLILERPPAVGAHELGFTSGYRYQPNDRRTVSVVKVHSGEAIVVIDRRRGVPGFHPARRDERPPRTDHVAAQNRSTRCHAPLGNLSDKAGKEIRSWSASRTGQEFQPQIAPRSR